MEMPKTDKERRELIKRIASKKLGSEDVKPGRKVSKEFWTMPRPNIPVDLLLEALLDDRRQGR